MLDHVERRRLLVEPARKDTLIAPVALPHVELNEGPGELLDFPGRGRLAGAEADDHVADARRLARAQGEFAGEPVALVEQAEHRDPLGHRRRSGREPGYGLGNVDRLGRGVAVGPVDLGRAARAAAGEREQRGNRDERAEAGHAPSGVHA